MTTTDSLVKIEQRLLSVIGIREWGLPSLITPGKIWRSQIHGTISCMVPADDPNKVRTETYPLEVVGIGEPSVMPIHWRQSLWEYCQEYPASGCCYGPLLAITEQQRFEFLRQLGQQLAQADKIGCRHIAHNIGQFAAIEYHPVEE